MYVDLNKNYIEKTKKEANDRAKEMYGDGDESSKTQLIYEGEQLDKSSEFDELYFEDGNIHISLSNDLGYFNLEIPVKDDLAFEIIEYMKSKGEKIKRLINLVD